MREQIAELLRRRRVELGLSLKQAGAVLGISSVQYRKYEMGEDRIAAERLAVLAQAWNLSLDALLGATPPCAADAALDREIQGVVTKLRQLPARERQQVRRVVDQLSAAVLPAA